MEITKILLDTENDIRDDDMMFRVMDDAKRKQIVFKNHDGEHFLYSYVNGEFGDGEMIDETYVFPCGETGKTTGWNALFSVEGYMSVEDVMEEMEIEDTMSRER